VKMTTRARAIQAQIGLIEVLAESLPEPYTDKWGNEHVRGPNGQFNKKQGSSVKSFEGEPTDVSDAGFGGFVKVDSKLLATTAKKNAEETAAKVDQAIDKGQDNLVKVTSEVKKERGVLGKAIDSVEKSFTEGKAELDKFMQSLSREGVAKQKEEVPGPVVLELSAAQKAMDQVYTDIDKMKASLESNKAKALKKLDDMTPEEIDLAYEDIKSAAGHVAKQVENTGSNIQKNLDETRKSLGRAAIAAKKAEAQAKADAANAENAKSAAEKKALGNDEDIPITKTAEDYSTLTGLQKMMDKVYSSIDAVKKAVGDAAKSAGNIKKTVEKTLGDAATAVGGAAMATYNGAKDGAKAAYEVLTDREKRDATVEDVGKKVKNMATRLKKSPHAMLAGIDAMGQSLKESNPEVLEELEKFQKEELPGIIDAMKGTPEALTPREISKRGYAKALAVRQQQVLQALQSGKSAFLEGIDISKIEAELDKVIDDTPPA